MKDLNERTDSFVNGQAKKVESSFIRAAKYDKEEQVLRLEFHGNEGTWHKYEEVSEKEARSFFRSPSKGRWFHRNIKAGLPKGVHLKPHSTEDREKKDGQG